MNTPEQLKNIFNNLIVKNAKKDEGLVISLSGDWGSGKTYFWKDIVSGLARQDKSVYISLFGKESLDDIKKSILLKLFKRNSWSKIFSDKVGQSKIIGFDLSAIGNLLSEKDFKDVLICFDDFERISTSINMIDILGYISELKEQYDCKIVMINNKSVLKEVDRLNDSIVFKIINNSSKKDESIEEIISKQTDIQHIDKHQIFNEKYRISKINNSEIFNKYSEKIIDVSLQYLPTVESNFNLVSKDLKVFDKQFIIYIIETTGNKKLNIRYMQQLITKLELLKFMKILNIEIEILNTISKYILEQVYSIKIGELNRITEYLTDIFPLQENLNYLIKDHFIDEEMFKEQILKLDENLKNVKNKKNISKAMSYIYNNFLYDFQYLDEVFVKEMNALFEEGKGNVISIISLGTFELYTNLLKKLSANDNYAELIKVELESYIDNIISNKEINIYDLKQELHNFIVKDNYLDNYIDSKLLEIQENTRFSKDSVINLIENIRRGISNNGYLNYISAEKHKVWLLEDKNYYKSITDFMFWFKKNKSSNLEKTYENLESILKDLVQQDKYKNKIQFFIDELEK